MFEFLKRKPAREIVSIRLISLKGDEPGVHRTHIKYADGHAALGASLRVSPEETSRKKPN